MPATIQKVTLFFEGRQHGWTESYWFASASGLHTGTFDPTRALCKARAQLLGSECKIKAFRISTEGTGPDALLKYEEFITAPLKGGSVGAPVFPSAAEEDVALQVRFENSERNAHKLTFLRGIWDAVETRHGKYTPFDEWNKRFALYRALLVDEPWGWWGVQSKVKKPLVSAVQGADDIVTFTTLGDLFAAGEIGTRGSLRISGVNEGHSVLNSVHLVQATATNGAKTLKRLAIGHNVVGGMVSRVTKGFIKFASCDDQKIVERKAGAPLLESRGRQRARARA